VITKDMAGNTIVQFFDAAIKLEVTPHITPDGNITLDLHPQVSDIAGYSPAGQPIISNQEVQTKVTVKDGETVVIGGVLKEQKKSSKVGLPLLLRIPIIRHIFANDEKSQSKTELMIFVTPKIVGME
ncbi:MAG TPA: type II and III secretion system protein, partial [candidate division WOR-3 bacterium]|nr:type II and III secretion system protein [candidate division WOR-3 bacterium]